MSLENDTERTTPGALRWSGPLLAFLGIASICALILETRSERTVTTWWILNSGLSAERVMPLAGLGVAIALARGRHVAVALATFLLGVVLGIAFRDRYLAIMADVPGVTTHLFLTGPVSALTAGLLLILPARVRRWILPVGAMLIGAMLGVATTLTDPTLHDPAISMIATLIGLWILAAIGLSGHAFWHGWFPIAARILGSWLIAIGLLLGGAAIASKPPVLAPPPPPASLTEGGANRFETPFPGINRQGDRSRNAARPSLP
ncbi:hypothetical protein LB543_19200 [Mesorhizobium sp. ESP7-2]|uniref:hypothetical protein n=1 Tax=Mesorhizobium sp. ESP7-2 TaxID=2876622 RepID=UPI001CCF2031|nr:hypothetical protein [Mesorhizobium sp. ESP7-2]MBZ9708850.1 hypothetical protein [Mesorhizobium sp. ESP7-2]